METFPRRLLLSSAAVFLTAFQLFAVIPFLLYAENAGEFASGPLNLFEQILVRGVPAAAALAVVLSLLPPVLFTRVTALLTGLGICLYLESTFFAWNVGQFDGREIDWLQFRGLMWRDYIAWGLILLLCIVLSKQLIRNVLFITGLITAVQVVTLAISAFSFSGSWRTTREIRNLEEFYRFSPDKNIIFLVLDSFEAPAFQQIISEEPEYAARFKDFTFFKNTLSPFPTTLTGVPAILSGIPYDNHGPIKEYLANVLPRSLPSVLYDQGFQVDLATLSHYCSWIKATTCTSLDAAGSADFQKAEKAEAARLSDVVLFRSAPGYLKRWIYNAQNWRLQQSFEKRKGPRQHVASIEFAEALERYARAAPGAPVFKYFHLMIPHLPIRLDSECSYLPGYSKTTVKTFNTQSKCALLLAERVLATLKRLGVYDRSEIFIFGDHGYPLRYFKVAEISLNIFKALPLLLVKKAGETEPSLQVSEVPAMITDLPATVIPFSYGRSLWSLGPDEKRERHYYNYHFRKDNWAKLKLREVEDFRIEGNAWDGNSWIKQERGLK